MQIMSALFQRVVEHKNSAIGKHFHEVHGRRDRLNESHYKIRFAASFYRETFRIALYFRTNIKYSQHISTRLSVGIHLTLNFDCRAFSLFETVTRQSDKHHCRDFMVSTTNP